MRIFLFTAVFMGLLCGGLSSPASAQNAVSVRTGAHADYSRLVFDWTTDAQYSVSKEGQRVLIRFGKNAEPDMSGIAADAKNILKVEKISTGTEPLQMAVTIPDGSRFRDFRVGNKLILDVYNPAGVATEKKAEATPAEKPKLAAEVRQAEPAQPAVQSPTPAPTPEEPPVKTGITVTTEQAPAVPTTKVENPTPVAPPAIEPHVITLTTTSTTGMGAFLRSGYLWIVVDNKDLTVAPQIAGPQKSRFPDFTVIEASGGKAYRLDLPADLHVYGEGGGLSWRIVMTPAQRKVASKSAVEENGSLVWPVAAMRNPVMFTDPDVGDVITVITATQSDQVAKGRKAFVELEQLDSVIGLAYVAKADDVHAEILPDRVKVGTPKGLTLSSSQDRTAQEIRAATQSPDEEEAEQDLGEAPPPATDAKTPEELNKAAQEKPQGNNIYNFSSWEMGGLTALDKNIHAIMMETVGKSGPEKTADIITMAKVNVANDRGPEALGLLRVAHGFVPDLENSAEFKALRGAASALAGKYDLAFNDFTEGSLGKYDDVKYWRAFTLAGLEDWKQAIDTMPSNFDPIASYPKQIRVPLALSFAEVSLRAGKVPQAEAILGMLEPDIKTLPLPDQASWNYLMGEAQRQNGNAEKAQEYWKPLVEGGKDYLFRAKAGLSLTRLQLDQKQLKPAEAIERLEGLRYAWRGDELETVINYRLGQMYVENKEFLKGLTVLRNAVSLTPGSELSREITGYMTRTFRDIFANDRLKDISPLDAISLYEEFKELTPAGEEGDRFVEKLAERLVQSDLLGRAASLLEYQVNHRLHGDKKAEIAIRLAAIRLLDGNPDGALRSLEIAQSVLNGAPAAATAATTATEKTDAETTPAKPLTSDSEKQRQVNLLKARALSMQGKTDDAMVILEKMRLDADVNKLRADIAWDAGRWEDAAMALNDLMLVEDISPRKDLSEYQTGLIMNRAIALNLSDNRVALANLRQRHKTQMDKTDKAKIFDVVSRPRRPDMVGSRESIERMISEISLFKGFLDSYGKMVPNAPQPAATIPAPAATSTEAPAPQTAQENGGTAEVPAAE